MSSPPPYSGEEDEDDDEKQSGPWRMKRFESDLKFIEGHKPALCHMCQLTPQFTSCLLQLARTVHSLEKDRYQMFVFGILVSALDISDISDEKRQYRNGFYLYGRRVCQKMLFAVLGMSRVTYSRMAVMVSNSHIEPMEHGLKGKPSAKKTPESVVMAIQSFLDELKYSPSVIKRKCGLTHPGAKKNNMIYIIKPKISRSSIFKDFQRQQPGISISKRTFQRQWEELAPDLIPAKKSALYMAPGLLDPAILGDSAMTQGSMYMSTMGAFESQGFEDDQKMPSFGMPSSISSVSLSGGSASLLPPSVPIPSTSADASSIQMGADQSRIPQSVTVDLHPPPPSIDFSNPMTISV